MSATNTSASSAGPDGAATTRATLVSLAKELLIMSESFEPKQEQIFAVEPEIVLKAKAFIAAAQTPVDYSMATVSSVMGAAVIRTLSHLKAFQAIPYPDGATAEIVANSTGSQTSLIERLLRAAASVGFLSYHVPSRVYKHTHLSAPWAQTSSPAEDVFTMCYDSGLAPMILLPDWLGHNNPQQASEPSGENSGTHNPLTYYNHTEGKTIFETLARHPENLAVFGRVLKAAASFRPFTGIYPWERLADADPQRPLFVDIGGGTGHAIAAILARDALNSNSRKLSLAARHLMSIFATSSLVSEHSMATLNSLRSLCLPRNVTMSTKIAPSGHIMRCIQATGGGVFRCVRNQRVACMRTYDWAEFP